MPDILFACPHCGQQFEAPPEMAGDQVACPSCKQQLTVPGLTPPPAPPAPAPTAAPRGSLAGRIVAGVVAGFIMSALAGNILTILFADLATDKPSKTVNALVAVLALGLWAGSIVVAVRSSRPGKAWRRLLIPDAILAFSLPLAVFIAAGRAATNAATKGAQISAGAYAVSGTLVAFVAGVFGFFLGAICLTVGLLVGRDPKK